MIQISKEQLETCIHAVLCYRVELLTSGREAEVPNLYKDLGKVYEELARLREVN